MWHQESIYLAAQAEHLYITDLIYPCAPKVHEHIGSPGMPWAAVQKKKKDIWTMPTEFYCHDREQRPVSDWSVMTSQLRLNYLYRLFVASLR